MRRGCSDHSGISDRERTADESAQDVNQETVVRIQLDDVSIAIVAQFVLRG
jgi:hypothetical protein